MSNSNDLELLEQLRGALVGQRDLGPTCRLVFDRPECRCNPRIVSLDLRPMVSPERRAASVVLGF